MKLKNKVLALLAPACAVGAISPIFIATSCSCHIKDLLNLSLKYSDHIKSVQLSTNLFVGESITFTCNCEAGWKQISSEKTKITCGDKIFVEGTDYKIEDNVLTILSNKTTNEKLEVYIDADPTIKSFDFSWNTTGSIKQMSNCLLAKPSDKITTTNLQLTGIYGDESEKIIEYGGEDNQFILVRDISKTPLLPDWKEVSNFKTDGYTFDETDLGETAPKQVKFGFKFKYNNSYVIESINCICGKAPSAESYKIKEDTNPIKVKETRAVKVEVGSQEYSVSTYEIVDGQDIAQISESGLIYAKAAGTIKVKATSIFDETISATQEYTLVSE